MDFDSDMNEYVVIGPMIEMDEGNFIDHTIYMAYKSSNKSRDMQLIHAWVNEPNLKPGILIDWPRIGASPINEYITKGLLDMKFLTLFPNENCDWIGARKKIISS